MKSSEIEEKLSTIISGHVFTQKEILNYYSVDSSAYQIKPKAVVVPANIDDVKKITKFASKNKIPLTPRGGGTGLVGSALGDGIIVDLKELDSIKISKNIVTVGPGVRKGHLDKILLKYNKMIGPNPSVGPYCTIGGMIGTNASGSKSLKYGSMIDNLKQITLVTNSGSIVKFPSKNKITKKVVLIAKNTDVQTFPKVTKNSCGYRLDVIKKNSDTQKIFAASEGTLGIIVSAKIKTYDIPQKKQLEIVQYDSAIKAAKDCINISKTKPSALEFIDKPTLKNIKYNFPKNTSCLLFVEYDQNISKNIKILKSKIFGEIILEIKKEHDIEKWWKYRDLALSYSLKKIGKNEKAPHIIEDATVSIENLPKLIRIIENLQKKTPGRIIVYGHAGNGNLHVRLISKIKSKKIIRKIAHDYFSKIILLNGSITGEHGDGLARSEFVKKQYGPSTYSSFKKIKKEFDPKGIFNPDKIITKKTLIQNLKMD